MLALPFMMHSKKYPNAIHDHEIEVMVKNVAFLAMLASHVGPTFKQRQNISVNLSPGFKNEFYPLQRGFQSFVNFAWISRGFRVNTNKC